MPETRPIAVFGGATVDRLATAAQPMTGGASNPGRLIQRPGGVGFSVAIILARLGHRVRLVTAAGRDDDGRRVQAVADAAGVDTTGVAYPAGYATGTYTALFDADGELYAGIADMGVVEALPRGAGLEGAALDGEIFVVDANLSPATLEEIAAHGRDNGHPLAALTVSPAKCFRIAGILPDLTWVIANRKEATSLTAAPTATPAADLAERLVALGAANAVVTDGAGAVAIAGADLAVPLEWQPPATPVVRVNGAGDSLAAGILHRLAVGQSLADAVPSGLAAAAMTLEHGGIDEAMFSPDRLASMTDMIEGTDA